MESIQAWHPMDGPEAPPDDRLLLVAVLHWGHRIASVHIGQWDRDRGWRTRWGKKLKGRIIEWMELPKPPRVA